MRNRLIFFGTLAIAAVLIQSCGGTGPSPAQNTLNSEVCTMTISGAVTAQVSCFAIGVYDPVKNETTLAVTLKSPSGSISSAALTVKVSGNLQSGTFSDANATSYGAGLVSGTQGAPSVWVVSAQPKAGNVSISVSGSTALIVAPGTATPGAPPAGTTGYTIHGSAYATLIPQMGATGQVSITARF